MKYGLSTTLVIIRRIIRWDIHGTGLSGGLSGGFSYIPGLSGPKFRVSQGYRTQIIRIKLSE